MSMCVNNYAEDMWRKTGRRPLYSPQANTMYLRGMKYMTRVPTNSAVMASQLRKGTVQLNVLYRQTDRQTDRQAGNNQRRPTIFAVH